jgi:hypothetical protein
MIELRNVLSQLNVMLTEVPYTRKSILLYLIMITFKYDKKESKLNEDLY